MLVRSHDRVVARLGEVARLPVERLDESSLVVDHHRFLVSEVELRIAVAHVDAGGGKNLARFLVLLLAAAARGIQHHAYLYAAFMGSEHSFDQRGIGEQEHPDVERAPRRRQGVENRFRGVVGKDNQRMGHGVRMN